MKQTVFLNKIACFFIRFSLFIILILLINKLLLFLLWLSQYFLKICT